MSGGRMTREEIIEQIENAIELIKQDGKDWLDDRDIPILEECIKSLTALDKIKAKIAKRTIEQGFDADEWSISYNELMKIIDKYDTRKKVR